MAHNLREAVLWRKEKTPILRKYIGEHSKLMSEIAGRGFSFLPGYAYDLENDIELIAKLGLSEVNFKILSETIERELKQQGIDYDLSYRAAAIAWEVEKQALLAAWNAELAVIKQGMALEEEILQRLVQEVSARQIVLIESKAAIDLEMEDYRLTLAELDGQTAPYEAQLANAKVLTARKKLEVIPVLQKIIAKEQELLALEGNKAVEYAALMDARREVAAKKELLLPGYLELANLYQAYAALIPGQIAIETAIAGEKIKQAQAVNTKANYQLDELEADIDAANARIGASEAERDVRDARFDTEQNLLEADLGHENAYQTLSETFVAALIAGNQTTQAAVNANKRSENTARNTIKETSTETITQANMNAAEAVNSAEIEKIRQVAEINAAANITASLRHLIG